MGIRFNGTSQRAVSNVSNFITGWSEYTITSWIKSNRTNTDQGWVNFIAPNGQDRFGGPRYDQTGANGRANQCLKFGLEINGSERVVESRPNVQTTELQFIVGRWKTNFPTELFIDADASGYTDRSSPVSGTISTSPNFVIGQGPKENANNSSWDGIIYDVRVYNRWLTDDEITTMHYAKGTDDFYGGLRLWYKFLDGGLGQTPSTLFDWSDTALHLPVTGDPILTEAAIGFRRR